MRQCGVRQLVGRRAILCAGQAHCAEYPFREAVTRAGDSTRGVQMHPRFGKTTLQVLASSLLGLALVAGGASSILAQHTSTASAAKPATQAVRGGMSHAVVRSGSVNLATLPVSHTATTKPAPGPTRPTARSRLPRSLPRISSMCRRMSERSPRPRPRLLRGRRICTAAATCL